MIIQLRGCPRCLWYHSWHHTLWIISLLMKVSEWVGFVSIFAFAWDYWSHSTEKIIFSPETSLSKSQSNLLYLKNLFTTVFHFFLFLNFFVGLGFTVKLIVPSCWIGGWGQRFSLVSSQEALFSSMGISFHIDRWYTNNLWLNDTSPFFQLNKVSYYYFYVIKKIALLAPMVWVSKTG